MDFMEVASRKKHTPPAPVPEKSGPLDLNAVKRRLEEYAQPIADLSKVAASLEVKDEATNHQAVEIGSGAKQLNKRMEEARKTILAPAQEFTKTVNNLFKPVQGGLEDIEGQVKRKISAYQAQVELERRRREEAQRQAAAALQKKIDEEAKKAGVETVAIVVPVEPVKPTVTRTEAGSAHQRTEWKFTVEDEAKVPREYLVVDASLIRQAVRAGIREILGVKIFEESTTVFR